MMFQLRDIVNVMRRIAPVIENSSFMERVVSECKTRSEVADPISVCQRVLLHHRDTLDIGSRVTMHIVRCVVESYMKIWSGDNSARLRFDQSSFQWVFIENELSFANKIEKLLWKNVGVLFEDCQNGELTDADVLKRLGVDVEKVRTYLMNNKVL